MENCNRPNSGTVSRIQFQHGIGNDHRSGITSHDSDVKRSKVKVTTSRISLKKAITQEHMVLLSSYLRHNMRTTPNDWGTKWLPW